MSISDEIIGVSQLLGQVPELPHDYAYACGHMLARTAR